MPGLWGHQACKWYTNMKIKHHIHKIKVITTNHPSQQASDIQSTASCFLPGIWPPNEESKEYTCKIKALNSFRNTKYFVLPFFIGVVVVVVVLFREALSYSPGCPVTQYADQAVLELTKIHLPLLPECLD